MIYLSKKSIILVIILVLVTVFSIGFYAIEINKDLISLATIVIDAGHGGMDGGVVGKSGVKEADINLAQAKKIKERLERLNFNVVLTRETKDSYSDIKIEDMKKRKQIIEKACPDIIISVHANKCKYEDRRGVQIFYDESSKISHDFAKMMQSSFNTYINSKYCKRDDLECLKGDFYITKFDPIPAIIVECGFLSNSEDEKLLKSSRYQEDIAKTIGDVLYSLYSNRIN